MQCVITTGNMEYPFNVQLWGTAPDGSKYYTGNGRFCKTREEAISFMQQEEDDGHD